MSTAALSAAALVVLLICSGTCSAGILLPEAVSFDVTDLERQFNGEAEGTGKAPAKTHSRALPQKESDENKDSLKAALPTSSSSSRSSSSSSSAGGASGSNFVLCLFNSPIAIADDSPLGRLAEDRGLSLPDPPGTDLLRPPQV